MTPENFIYWLQGFVEIGGGKPTDRQWEIIKDHINLVLNKITQETSQEFDKQKKDQRYC